MARVTVEDDIQRVPDRFELVLVAAQRARDIAAGAPIQVARDNDKNPVVALREIADQLVSADALRNTLIRGLQRHVEYDEEPEEEIIELMAGEQEWVDPDMREAGATTVEAPDEAVGEPQDDNDLGAGGDAGAGDDQ